MARITNPVYSPHYRLTALGTLGTTEAFSFSLALAKTSSLYDPTAAHWTDVAEDVRAFFASPDAPMSASAVLRQVKVAPIGADGLYSGDPAIIDVVPTAGTRGGNTAAADVASPQDALVVSLGSDRRGPRGRGRFYLPMPAIVTDRNTFQIPSAQAENIEAAVAVLINNLNNEPGLDAVGNNVVVASSEGANHRVTSVRVGRVIDTVRSRRRSLVEDYRVPTVIA